MKKNLILILIGILFLSFNCKEKNVKNTTFQNGDIIFQTSESQQCEAVRIATDSKFSHCGIIFIEDGKTYVYEAVQPVKMTLFEDWISQGRDAKYAVQRLKNANKILTTEVLKKNENLWKHNE